MTIYDEPRLEVLTEGYFTAGNNATRTAGNLIEDIAPLLGIIEVFPTLTFLSLKTEYFKPGRAPK